jgi:hypothetical protein
VSILGSASPVRLEDSVEEDLNMIGHLGCGLW